MSAINSKRFEVASAALLKLEEEASVASSEKQGIGSILGSDDSQQNKGASLRRTLSADMSSKNWVAHNGFSSPIKRNNNINITSPPPESDGNEEDEMKNMPSQEQVWRTIMQKATSQPASAWSSILAENTKNETNDLPPPYIHPLVRRSGSTLSHKSLEICTESLGSETGSDSLLLCSSSEEEDDDNKEDSQEQQLKQVSEEDIRVAKYNYNPSSKRLGPRMFPPPLLSLARGEGASLQMHSHRDNGRLVLEAVSVPQKNCFRAERQQGRLLLSIANGSITQDPRQEEAEEGVGEFEEVYYYAEEEQDVDEDVEEGEEEVEGVYKEMEFVVEQSTSLASGGMNVGRPAVLMKRLMRIGNKDPTWSDKLNKAVNFMEMDGLTPIPQSLPPAPRVARLIPSPPPPSTLVATYKYFWKKKPTENKIVLKGCDDYYCHQQQQKQDQLVPFLSGCKDSRKSLLIWQPYCVATS